MQLRIQGWVVCWTVTACLLSTCLAEIHRAKSLKTKPRHPDRVVPGTVLRPQDDLDSRTELYNESWVSLDGLKEFLSGPTSESRKVWLYSMVASSLVGLTGILPLLIIPLEAGDALRKGVASSQLKLLLSFAVGGLLGDVFLHLLPEAWAHLDRLGGAQVGHRQIALWLLTGLLSFMIIEKIFPEKSDEDDAVEEEEIKAIVDISSETSQTNDVILPTTEHVNKQYNLRTINGKSGGTKRKRSPKTVDTTEQLPEDKAKSGGHRNGFAKKTGGRSTWQDKIASENRRRLTIGDRVAPSEEASVQSHTKEQKQESQPVKSPHIKTSGWLNLMANMIDNFTHGLAVAGSFSVSTKTGVITTFAILLHEVPHEIGDFAILLRAGFDRWRAAKAQFLTAFGGLLGAIVALSAESCQSAGDRSAWILPFTSGGFIYIAMVTLVPDLLKDNDPWNSLKQFVLLCTGVAVMAAVTIFVD